MQTRVTFMTEINKRHCKICLNLKQRILNGKYPNGKDSCWVDENSRQWNGKVCPDCNVKRCKDTMKKVREKHD